MDFEGEFLDNVLYLVDKAAGKVFSSEDRDPDDNFVQVGVWSKENGITLTNSRSSVDTAVSSVNVVDVAASTTKKTKKKQRTTDVDELEKQLKKKRRTDDDVSATNDDFPFEVDAEDHCETPLDAYEHLLPYLRLLFGDDNKDVCIYDPYYCNGNVKRQLASLGYSNVINERKDFYASIESHTVPDYDVLITNPPFSGDHIERIFDFCINKQNKPFFILVPNYVYTKEYYMRITSHRQQHQTPLCVLAPVKRYVFRSPDSMRVVAHRQQLNTSPFPCLWYIELNGFRDRALQQHSSTTAASNQVDANLYSSPKHLPATVKSSYDRSRKRLRKNQRKKNK